MKWFCNFLSIHVARVIPSPNYLSQALQHSSPSWALCQGLCWSGTDLRSSLSLSFKKFNLLLNSFTHTCTITHFHVHVHTCTDMHTHMRNHTLSCARAHMLRHTHRYAITHFHVHMHRHAHTHAQSHTLICTCTHAQTGTHTHMHYI